MRTVVPPSADVENVWKFVSVTAFGDALLCRAAAWCDEAPDTWGGISHATRATIPAAIKRFLLTQLTSCTTRRAAARLGEPRQTHRSTRERRTNKSAPRGHGHPPFSRVGRIREKEAMTSRRGGSTALEGRGANDRGQPV